MSKRTDSDTAADEKTPVKNLNVQVDAGLHTDAKVVLARKGKTFREVVEKSLRQEVATAK